MKDKLLIGIFCLLVIIAGMLSLILYNQYVRHIILEDPLSLKNLKIAEEERWIFLQKPGRNGQVNERALQAFQMERETSLARADVSEFFKKDIPLDKPNMPIVYVMTWAALAVSSPLTFGFSDYEARLSLASDHFTEKGWEGFLAFLNRSQIVDRVTKHQAVLSSAVTRAPTLNSSGVVDGRYQWVYRILLVMSHESGSKTLHTGLLVTVVIVRTDDPKYPYGIAIDQWTAVPRNVFP